MVELAKLVRNKGMVVLYGSGGSRLEEMSSPRHVGVSPLDASSPLSQIAEAANSADVVVLNSAPI